MKPLAACLLLALCAGAAPAASPANYNAFGITALRRLSANSKTRNVVLSPLSMGLALAMAADGAKGSTRDQLLNALGVSSANLDAESAALTAELRANPDASAGIANALWTREDVTPNASYVQTLQRTYDARAHAVRFGDPSAAQTINEWTKAHTLGLIGRIVDRTSASDFLYLTNALAFKAAWARQFKKRDTREMPFTNADGSKSTVEMMSQSGIFGTVDEPGFRALRMPYGKGGYAAYILLPSGADAAPLLAKLTAAGFDRLARAVQPSFMQIEVPRFTASYGASLVPLLKSMGITDAFSDAANFTGVHAVPPRLFISSVEHAAYVRVDEAGTTAAAATSAGMTMTAIRVPEKTFVVDRPFVLALRDERTGALLFLGIIQHLARV